MRVLVVHNRYRYAGGEERAVDLQVEALERAGVPTALLTRDSSAAGARKAATAMLRGGDDPQEVADAVERHQATVVHVHNMHPLFGHRALEAAKAAGAKTVLHLHNYRLFCAIGIAFRDGADCFRCRGRNTLPGLRLNCRGSLPEAAVYAASLAAHQRSAIDAADALITPSRYAADRLTELGLPGDKLHVVANYVPDIADRSRADEGTYALAAGRLAVEKGYAYAIEAAALAGVPLKIAGDGPLRDKLPRGGDVEFLGLVEPARVKQLLHGAALALVPSISGDVMPFAALEAMAAGVPIAASDAGSLPEVVGAERTVPKANARALADRIPQVYGDSSEGDALIARAHELFGERRYVEQLLAVYGHQ
jgi:glycosyltransferase involved in cell wall biosynthesis